MEEIYERQMDLCGLYRNEVNDDGGREMDFFLGKNKNTLREGDMAKRKYGVVVWKK